MIETGHLGDEILGPAHMGATANAGYAEVVRLEVLAEELVESSTSMRESWTNACAQRLERRRSLHIGPGWTSTHRVPPMLTLHAPLAHGSIESAITPGRFASRTLSSSDT